VSLRRSANRQPQSHERQIGQVFHALADPTRRRVVERLSSSPASMTELARPFKMALPSFAQHLGVLEHCGLVRSRKEGRVRRYQLVPSSLATAENWMLAQRKIWEQRLDRMQEYVEEIDVDPPSDPQGKR
jgi:DNA-binding transcriptional ArsR family regulator